MMAWSGGKDEGISRCCSHEVIQRSIEELKTVDEPEVVPRYRHEFSTLLGMTDMPPVVLVRFVSARIFVGDSLKLRFPNSGDEEMAVVASEVVEYDSDRLSVRIDPQLEVARAVCWSTICAGDVIVIAHS